MRCAEIKRPFIDFAGIKIPFQRSDNEYIVVNRCFFITVGQLTGRGIKRNDRNAQILYVCIYARNIQSGRIYEYIPRWNKNISVMEVVIKCS